MKIDYKTKISIKIVSLIKNNQFLAKQFKM